MTASVKTFATAGLLLINTALFSQTKKDSLGLPGDNFDLYGALDLFKQSASPEAFEKAINDPNNEINNLDLDADGKVDYVKVVDKSKGDSHSLVLQVAVSKTETQDVAVLEIEKPASGTAHVQIVGDEELYGKDYIVEPKDEANGTASKSTAASSNNSSNNNTATNSSNYNVDNSSANNNNYPDDDVYANGSGGGGPQVMINVWGWPSVQYLYGPSYVGWASPYYYGYYPGWFSPWQPIYWHAYYRRVYRYHYPYYHRTSYYRCQVAHNYYYGMRSSSGIVRGNNQSGLYHQRQAGYSRNVTHGSRYNSMPAQGGRRVGDQRARENNVRVDQGNNPRSQQHATEQGGRTPRAMGTTVNPANNQPRQVGSGARAAGAQSQPRQQANPQSNPVRSQPQAQPQHVNSQPRQAAPQARPMERSQPAPASRGMSAPHGPGGGVGGGGGGGRRGR